MGIGGSESAKICAYVSTSCHYEKKDVDLGQWSVLDPPALPSFVASRRAAPTRLSIDLAQRAHVAAPISNNIRKRDEEHDGMERSNVL